MMESANAAEPPPMAMKAAEPASAPSPAAAPAAPAANVPTSGPRPVAAVDAARPEMLDIEAHLSIEVASVPTAAAALRGLARRFQGVVTDEQFSQSASAATAQMTLRIPSVQVDAFFDATGTVGKLLSRQINARDVGKEYFDAQLRVENLETTMRRYEEVLKQAKTVDEILRIESELGRLRGEIEQVKGNLRWLADRAARATVHINLVTTSNEIATSTEVPPEVKFYPGLRFTLLEDFHGEQGNTSYVGGGVAVGFSRHFALQLDGLRESGTGSPTKGLDVVLLTLGGEWYSDFLGAGKRRYLNPYLGYALGYAHFTGKDQLAAGATLGLELFKAKAVTIDLNARAMGLFFGSNGTHLAVEPVIGVSVPF
jgi:hypothetical protein